MFFGEISSAQLIFFRIDETKTSHTVKGQLSQAVTHS
jgi:hypothetical protein